MIYAYQKVYSTFVLGVYGKPIGVMAIIEKINVITSKDTSNIFERRNIFHKGIYIVENYA